LCTCALLKERQYSFFTNLWTTHLTYFLHFARLAEHKDMLVALSDWVAWYGLLGLHRSNGRGRKAKNLGSPQDFRHDRWPLLEEPEDYSDRGGEGETRVMIEREMLLANRLLLYWEAISYKEESHLERAILENQFVPKQAKDPRETYRRDYKHTGATYADMLVQDATFFVRACVQEVLEAFTYPCLALAPTSRKPKALTVSWRPRNLLGAMYLQFY